MKFGKLPNISNVDFDLPTDDSANTALLSNLPKRQGLPKVYIGCTGWGMKEWVGRVYPRSAKTQDYLRHYGRQFNTIELNTTHYRIPTFEASQKWHQSVPKDFHFCPKIPQTISHSADLAMSKKYTQLFSDNIVGLQGNLGCSFMQLPPYFGQERLALLGRFLKQFPKTIPLAIEVRHESWFANSQHFEALFRLLKRHNISWAITDVAGRRDVLHQRLTNETAMVRFVGNALHPTDYQRIDAWVERLKSWFEKGLHQAYVFTHEPDNLLAPELAEYMVQKVKASFEAEVRGPKFIKELPKQGSLF